MSYAFRVGLFAFFLFAGIHQLGSGSEQCIRQRAAMISCRGTSVAGYLAVGAPDSLRFGQVDDLQAALAKRARETSMTRVVGQRVGVVSWP